jgi:hypothetical protein
VSSTPVNPSRQCTAVTLSLHSGAVSIPSVRW